MVTVQQFRQALLKEADVLKEEATVYRQQTAAYSLQVLETVQEVTPFFNRASAMDIVARVLNTMDVDRQVDVAKMLHVLSVDLRNQQQFSADFREKVAERKRNRKRVSFVLTK